MTDEVKRPPSGEHAVLPKRNAVAVSAEDPIEVKAAAVTAGAAGLVLGITEADIRLVDAYFHELAIDASEDPSPPTPEEQASIDVLRESFERLKAMTPEELDAERARRWRKRRRREGR